MNGYDAQDMATQGADGFRNGYQAGYADAVNAIEAAQPAAAQEAVATVESYTNGSYHRNYKLRWHKDVDAGTQLFAAPVTAAPGIDMHAPCTEAVYAMARKLLWIAYVWNDHNFDHPYKVARELAQELGIESFDQANAWLTEQAKLIDAGPKGGSETYVTLQRTDVKRLLAGDENSSGYILSRRRIANAMQAQAGDAEVQS